jgi:hypothetical protein
LAKLPYSDSNFFVVDSRSFTILDDQARIMLEKQMKW